MSGGRVISALLVTACAVATQQTSAQSLDVVMNPIPQAYSNTCQSYALGFALARAGVPGFRLDTLAEVRALEARVRAAIDAEVEAGETAYHHAVWIRAVKRLTSNNYVLNRKEYTTADALMNDIAAKTGITAAGTLGPVLSVSASATPVMTSFRKIRGNTYATGHIVTVFGLDRPSGPVTTVPKLMLLNSAVKRPQAAPPVYAALCSASDLPGDLRYTGALALEADYELTSYSGKYVLLWVSRRSGLGLRSHRRH
jgi:hypothetical protein